MAKEVLDVVDESGITIGRATREQIHRDGLLHREIHVWLYTPDGKIIFQHRGKNMDTFPDLLDATAGGHVHLDDDFNRAALRELGEETGLVVTLDDLTFLTKQHSMAIDRRTGSSNNALRCVYACKYSQPVQDLQIERGKSLGFEAHDLSDVLDRNEPLIRRMIPMLTDAEYRPVFVMLGQLIA